jgi:solute carrier family 25 carnitine/acylcarnitine transporter 20/29
MQAIPALDTCLYGALAGYVLWFGMYPLDVIKSKIQTDAFPSQANSRKYHGVADVVRKTLRAQGVGGFFKGFLPTIIRSPFANGATFMAYELTMRMIS